LATRTLLVATIRNRMESGPISYLGFPATEWAVEQALWDCKEIGQQGRLQVTGVEKELEIAEIASRHSLFGSRLQREDLHSYVQWCCLKFNASWLDFCGPLSAKNQATIQQIFERELYLPGVHAFTFLVKARNCKSYKNVDQGTLTQMLQRMAGSKLNVVPVLDHEYRSTSRKSLLRFFIFEFTKSGRTNERSQKSLENQTQALWALRTNGQTRKSAHEGQKSGDSTKAQK